LPVARATSTFFPNLAAMLGSTPAASFMVLVSVNLCRADVAANLRSIGSGQHGFLLHHLDDLVEAIALVALGLLRSR
jgi:hypothetical protein